MVFPISTNERSSTYAVDSLDDATAAGAVMMGGSYKQCDACGKRALSIANRCPGCGRDLPAMPVAKGSGGLELERFLTRKGVAAVLAVGAVLVSAKIGRTAEPQVEKPGVESSVAKTDVPALASHRPKRSDRASSGSRISGSRPDGVRTRSRSRDRLDTARVAAQPVRSGSQLRVAQSWTEVRQSRSGSAPVEAVLTPGDTVQADSLEQGWYRVALEGEVLGYAHRSTLAALR